MMTKRTLTTPGYDVSRSESLTRSSAEPGDRRFVESRHQYLAPEFVDRGLVLVDRLGRGLRVIGTVLRRIGDLITRFEPTITGWFGRINPFAFRIDEIDWPATASRFESGTPPVPNAYAALAALELLDRIGYDAIGRQVDGLVARYVAAARDAGFVVRTPADPARRGPLVVVQSVDAPALVQRLAGRGIIASCRGNGLRVAFHAYNNDADVDAVLQALTAESALLERTSASIRG